jgi:hypothetical protein
LISAGFVDDDPTPSAYPTNYTTNGTSAACGLGDNASVRLASSWRIVTTTSEDPGALTLPEVEATNAVTVAVH